MDSTGSPMFDPRCGYNYDSISIPIQLRFDFARYDHSTTYVLIHVIRYMDYGLKA